MRAKARWKVRERGKEGSKEGKSEKIGGRLLVHDTWPMARAWPAFDFSPIRWMILVIESKQRHASPFQL